MSDQLGEIWSYEDLHRIMRARANDLKLSRESIDAIAGLQPGYAAKLLSPRPIKKLGPLSIPLVLPVLGMKLIAVVDEQQTRDLQARISGTTRRESSVRSAATHFSLSHRFLRKIGRKGGQARRAKISKSTRFRARANSCSSAAEQTDKGRGCIGSMSRRRNSSPRPDPNVEISLARSSVVGPPILALAVRLDSREPARIL
jgi:hypothetical protein